jgi:LCP family protein required for cell wall assembly
MEAFMLSTPNRSDHDPAPWAPDRPVGPVRVSATAKKSKRRHSPLWARLLVVFGALLMLFSGGVLVGGKLLVNHYEKNVTHSGGLGYAAAEGKNIDGAINLLLVGIDERTADTGIRADSIMIAHIPVAHDSVYLTSIPRDARVKIPAHPKTRYEGGMDKINAAFQWGSQNGGGRDGGLELLAETVSDLAGGMKFNAAAIVNFDGFRGLVNAVGGVRMYVDEKVTSIHIGQNTKTKKEGAPYYLDASGLPIGLRPNMQPKVYTVGWHDFAAWEALDYVRQRDLLEKGDGDYGRQRHQQQFIKAIMSKTMSAGVLTNPGKVAGVLNSVGKAVSFYNNNIPLVDWIFTLKGIDPNQMITLKMNNGTFNEQIINNVSYQVLDDTSMAMLRAIAADQMAAFLAEHPDTRQAT